MDTKEVYIENKLEYAKKLANQRVINATMDIDKIPDTTKQAVYGILNGDIKNPVKGAMHFIASTANKNDSQNTALIKQREFASKRSDIGKAIVYSDATVGNNWFFTSPASDNFVLHISRNNKVMEAGMGFPGYFIIIGLVGYLLMKFTRK